MKLPLHSGRFEHKLWGGEVMFKSTYLEFLLSTEFTWLLATATFISEGFLQENNLLSFENIYMKNQVIPVDL